MRHIFNCLFSLYHEYDQQYFKANTLQALGIWLQRIRPTRNRPSRGRILTTRMQGRNPITVVRHTTTRSRRESYSSNLQRWHFREYRGQCRRERHCAEHKAHSYYLATTTTRGTSGRAARRLRSSCGCHMVCYYCL